jgi:NAD(P)-dependent dehydrogenase (short-subunit alcohol dehydrogenase family)
MTAKTWFITGTGSGLGRELTAHLLARGERVAATDIDPEMVGAVDERSLGDPCRIPLSR